MTTLRADHLTLTAVSLPEARALQNHVPPRPLFPGYAIDQLRLSAQVLLDHPQTRTVFVLEWGDDGVIGFVAIDSDAAQTDLAFVSFIDIAAPLQNQRYGRAALAALMKWATERGARRLVAEIPPSNEPSKRLFTRAGFRRDAAADRAGAIERWVWPRDAATDASLRRERLQLLMSSPINHEDVLADIGPFYRAFADQRSNARRATQHRLLRLVEAVEADRDAIRAQRPTQNLPELVELRHVANTLKAWEPHPLGKRIVGNLSDSTTYAHNILVLSAYRLLHTWENNDVQLVPEEANKATCDLDVAVEELHVGTELKTPAEMREGRHLSEAEAEEIALRVLKMSREQRRGQASVLLLVGGFQVPDTSLVLVSTALEAELEKSESRSNVAGAVALTVGRHAADLTLTIPRDKPLPGVFAQFAAQLNPEIFQMGVAARIARNRPYAGPVRVLRYKEPGIGLHLP